MRSSRAREAVQSAGTRRLLQGHLALDSPRRQGEGRSTQGDAEGATRGKVAGAWPAQAGLPLPPVRRPEATRLGDPGESCLARTGRSAGGWQRSALHVAQEPGEHRLLPEHGKNPQRATLDTTRGDTEGAARGHSRERAMVNRIAHARGGADLARDHAHLGGSGMYYLPYGRMCPYATQPQASCWYSLGQLGRLPW